MILSITSFPPLPDGHGGSQRAWHLTKALTRIGPVDLVLLHAGADTQAAEAGLDAVRPLVRSITRIPVAEWSPSWHLMPRLPKRIGRWIDLVRMGSVYAPRFSRRALRDIARQLPVAAPEVVFAGRLPMAFIVEELAASGYLKPRRKFVDFDDIQSAFQRREMTAERGALAFDKRLMDRWLLSRTARAENRIGTLWNGISVCSDDDRRAVAAAIPAARVFRVPNVVEKPLLRGAENQAFTLLFVGNLSFGPNVHGIRHFIEKAWPLIRAARPDVRMQIVGLNPGSSLRELIENASIELHANVPSVAPYYERADAVIAPIMFGGGTRVKILEAMAFGRAVVSTTIGAEGLGVEHGRHVLIADDMADFAAAIVRLAADADLRRRLAENGRALQVERFSQQAMDASVRAMLGEEVASPWR
jgi:polysaccharide biosynthesis protein PslH